MAQGDNFQFGAAHEIKNHKFRRPTLFVSTVASVETTILTINNAFDNTNKIVQVGDKVNVATSTGASENRTIKAIGDPGGGDETEITVDVAFALTYVASDVVVIKGTRLAGGWIRDGAGASEDALIEPFNIRPDGGGASDDYAQELRVGAVQTTPQGIEHSLSENLKDFRYYRIGGQWKADFDRISGNFPILTAYIKRSASLLGFNIGSQDQFTWTRFASTGIFVAQDTVGTTDKVILQARQVAATDSIHFYFDDLFVEHAFGTTSVARIKSFVNAGGGTFQLTIFGEVGTGDDQFDVSSGDEIAVDDRVSKHIRLSVSVASGSVITATSFSGSTSAIAAESRIQVKNDGYFTLADTPEMGSLTYDKFSSDRLSPLGDGSLKNFDPMSEGHASERWRFSCRFLGVSQANFDGMQILLRHQQNGSPISFHPFIDDLPHVMIGKLFLANYKKQYLFDLPSHDFTLKFEEMSI